MRLDVVTIFPDYLAPLDVSLIGKARRDGLVDLRVHNLRDFAHDRHRTVDDTPFGGGAGMVMKPEPWAEALDHVVAQGRSDRMPSPRLIVPGPGGVPFSQRLARELAQEPWLAFACGRYEGIDERVYEYAAARMPVTVVSLGDYVLNGGEVAVLAMVEAIVRLLPGVVGNPASLVEESHEGGLLEYPVYTKPASWDDGEVVREVPPILLSGNHSAIATWRYEQRVERTALRRPDLLTPSATAGLAGKGLDGLEVALAAPGDVAELLVLTRACWVPEAQLVPAARSAHALRMPPLTDTAEDLAASLSVWQTYVVRSAGRLVGSVRGRLRPSDESVWETGRLMVAPDLVGRGLGRALLAMSESLAPRTVRTWWINTGADSARNQRIYRKAGYRIVPSPRAGTGTLDMVKHRRDA